MQSGRKPKPTAVKALEGNPGKRSLNTGEPKPEKKAPRCPAWLEGEAKKEWKRMAGQMEKLGILTEIDMAAFAGYCQAYARWKEAEEFITQHGTIVKTPSGYWQKIQENGEIGFENPVAMPGAVSIALDPNGEPESFYADGIEYYIIANNMGYDGDLELALIPESFRTDVLKEEADNNEVLVENAHSETAAFALLFEFDGDIRKIRHVLYNCSASRPKIEGKTNEESREVQTETLTIKARPLASGYVKAKTGNKTVEKKIAELEQQMMQYGDVKPATEVDVSGKLENLRRLMEQPPVPEDGEFSEEAIDKYVFGVRVYEDRFEWLLNLSPEAHGELDDAGSPVYFTKLTVTPDDERAWFKMHPQWSKSNKYVELEAWIFI